MFNKEQQPQGDIVKTEIRLSDDSVQRIIAAETAKALLNSETVVETFVRQVINYRKPKQYSSDKENPTFMEEVIQKAIGPMVEAEIKRLAEEHYATHIRAAVKKTFGEKVAKGKELEKKFSESFANALSKMGFYWSDNTPSRY